MVSSKYCRVILTSRMTKVMIHIEGLLSPCIATHEPTSYGSGVFLTFKSCSRCAGVFRLLRCPFAAIRRNVLEHCEL